MNIVQFVDTDADNDVYILMLMVLLLIDWHCMMSEEITKPVKILCA